jgi:voltage-gated potassium channel Kch
MLWILFYVPVLHFDPDAFFFANIPEGVPQTTWLSYFSFVTLTTLGYGDVAPVAPLARGLAMTEAITGTLFLAVLISRLVAAYGLRRRQS